MSDALADLQPSRLWKHFAAISAIPRSSRSEVALTRYVTEVATKAGCAVRRDRAGHLIIKCKATPGLETAPSICLQGHLDTLKVMSDDDGVDTRLESGTLHREGSLIRMPHALVAPEQGITVAAMLALIEDVEQAHGPLECLLTVDEAGVMPTSRTADASLIESRLLFNLESEEEGSLTIGGAGTRETIGFWKPLWEELYDKGPAGVLEIRGLRGGHASFEQDLYRGNAIKLMARILLPLHDRGVRIASIHGGERRSAVPREAEAYLYVPTKRMADIQDLISSLESTIGEELRESDPNFKLQFVVHGIKKGKVLKRVQIRRILHLINAMPNGVVRMSQEIPGLVQTSSQIYSIGTNRKQLSLFTSQRSYYPSELEASSSSIVSLLDIGGAVIEQSQGQIAWKPHAESELLRLAESNFEKIYQRKPELRTLPQSKREAVQVAEVPEREMVSFGPALASGEGDPDSLDVGSIERFWLYLNQMVRSVGEEESNAHLLH